MNDLYNAVKDWHIILQGAIGSGLFWVVLIVGQKIVVFASDKFSYHNKNSRISWLASAALKYQPCEYGSTDETHVITSLVYRSIRLFYKSMLWVILGFVINMFFYPLGIIGFIGGLYFLFKASEVVSPIEQDDDMQLKYDEIIEELNNLKKT